MRVGVVVIGRNEGERLRRCLMSLTKVETRVYVDSGSIDGSQDLARTLGFAVVELDNSQEFTAARARNAGVERLLSLHADIEAVQFVDGDCEVHEDWLRIAAGDLAPGVAVVFGRRRERFPGRNLYHRSCDMEWQVPTGKVGACGGDALCAIAPFRSVGGYNPAVVAGEEPELCLRLRREGWTIWSNGAEMTLHDVAIDRFGQWWRRSKRTGFGFGALLSLHGAAADPSWRRLIFSSLSWTGVFGFTLLGLLLALISGRREAWAATGLGVAMLLFGITRTAWRRRQDFAHFSQAWSWAGLLFVAKLAHAQGLAEQCWQQLRARPARIIEYK